MNLKNRMTSKFQFVEGGLFAKITKADIGEGVGNLMAKGYKIMAWADPYFPDPSIPQSVKNTMIEAVQSGLPSHYTMPMGNRKLRELLATKVSQQFNRQIDPSRNILITPGSDSGLLYAMMPYLKEGDEILIPDPSYPSNFVNTKLCGAMPISVPIIEENNYQLKISEFEKRLTEKTKMVILTHPNNPTSTVFRKESLEALSAFIIKHDLILVCDQAFEDHIFDDIKFVSPASIPGMFERTITVFSISKGLGLSGFRVGYIVADESAMDVYYGAAVNFLGATNTLAQIGAIAAIQDRSILKNYYKILKRRRDLAYEIFRSIPSVIAIKPESGILSWLNIKALGSSEEVADFILEDAKISINAGIAYGPLGGEGYIRIVHACFANEEEALEAYNKIKNSLIKMAKLKQLL